MCCQGFKGGTGSSSRLIDGTIFDAETGESKPKTYTIAALVQANYGAQRDFRIGGFPIGRLIVEEREAAVTAAAEKNADAESTEEPPQPTDPNPNANSRNKDGSIIIILATDAPLHPTQLRRLAKRATVGLARVGGWGSNTSGDIFLAFSTATEIQREPGMSWAPRASKTVHLMEDQSLNALFEAAAESVEESIYNAVCMAEDMVGPLGYEMKAMDYGVVKRLMEKYL